MMVQIWIDADAAPGPVKQIVFRAAKRRNVPVVLVANRKLDTPAALPMVRSIRVSEGADQADRYIAKHGRAGDIAITADVPLASQLVDNGLYVVDPRGEEHTADTIASRLSMRNFLDGLRGAGIETSGQSAYRDVDKKAFAATFDRLLTRATRS